MGYGESMKALKSYRDNHIAALLGEASASWFTEAFGGLSAMLSAFNSDAENKAISGSYSSGRSDSRVTDNIKLDYVCGLRREVRKQYVSGEDGIYTDVTPFRHGIMSAHGANIFDNALDQVLAVKEEQ